MSHDFTPEEIESAKEEIEAIQSFFLEQFRNEINHIVEEPLPTYEGCCKYRRVYSEQSYDKADERAKALMKEAWKQLQY